MKYVNLTLKYFTFKKIIRLILLSLIPAIGLSFFTSNGSIANYIINFNEMDSSNFWQVYKLISGFQFKDIWQYLLIIVLLTAFVSEIYGIVERDMHVGDFRLRGFFRRINNNAFPLGLAMVLITVSVWLLGLIASALFTLMGILISGWILPVILLFISILLFYLLVTFWIMFFMVAPLYIHTGQPLRLCIKDSITQVRGKYLNIIVAIVLPILLFIAVYYIERLLGLNSNILTQIIDIIINALMFVYYIVLVLVVYYDVTGLERVDMKPISRLFN